MKNRISLPYFNRQQRRGLFVLGLLIVFFQWVIYSFDDFFKHKPLNISISEQLQKEYDSLRQVALSKKKKKIYPFNPDYLTDYKGYYLGLNVSQIDSVLAFRKRGGHFTSKQQFKEVAGLSDSLFQFLEPYIKVVNFSNKNFPSKNFYQPKTRDINKASILDLQTVSGIGMVLSERIVKYRKSVGGFTDKKQLNNVYGLKPEVVAKVWQKFKLIKSSDKPVVHLVEKPVNEATVEDFKQVYGIGDKLAGRIVKYRQKIGGFTIKEQLNDVYGLPPETIDAFWRHFKIEKPAKIPFAIDLNEANIKELAKNPYISYQLAKKIVSYRTLNGAFHTFDDLKKVPEYPKNKHKQICLYLHKL